MRKVILGAFLSLSGFLSLAVLMVGALSQPWVGTGMMSAFDTLNQYGLLPFAALFGGVGLLGLVLGLLGLNGKHGS